MGKKLEHYLSKNSNSIDDKSLMYTSIIKDIVIDAKEEKKIFEKVSQYGYWEKLDFIGDTDNKQYIAELSSSILDNFAEIDNANKTKILNYLIKRDATNRYKQLKVAMECNNYYAISKLLMIGNFPDEERIAIFNKYLTDFNANQLCELSHDNIFKNAIYKNMIDNQEESMYLDIINFLKTLRKNKDNKLDYILMYKLENKLLDGLTHCYYIIIIEYFCKFYQDNSNVIEKLKERIYDTCNDNSDLMLYFIMNFPEQIKSEKSRENIMNFYSSKSWCNFNTYEELIKSSLEYRISIYDETDYYDITLNEDKDIIISNLFRETDDEDMEITRVIPLNNSKANLYNKEKKLIRTLKIKGDNLIFRKITK